MAIVKSLTRHGNSLALVIDKALLEVLEIGPKTSLSITTDGRGFHVYPLANGRKRKRLAAAIREVNRDHAPVLRRLAK
jgi:antitoxin MazE